MTMLHSFIRDRFPSIYSEHVLGAEGSFKPHPLYPVGAKIENPLHPVRLSRVAYIQTDNLLLTDSPTGLTLARGVRESGNQSQ